MKTLALAFLFALPLLLAAPRTVDADGNCPPSWDVWTVPLGWPPDDNNNGIVCGKYHEGKPGDLDVSLRMKDDR